MPASQPRHFNTPPPLSDEEIVRGTLLRCTEGLERQLAELSTANKNRALLALHAQIGEQLEALAADNHI
jgi:hypothetical protein